MAEYIEREAVLAELKERHDYVMQDPEVSKTMKWCEAVCFNGTKDIIDTVPAVDMAPVVHGRWNCVGHVCVDGEYEDTFRCSKCSIPYFRKSRYCPNCGARMDGERKDGEG